MGGNDKSEKHLYHYQQNNYGKIYLDLIIFEPCAQTSADLGPQGGSDQEQQGQDEIYGTIGIGLHDGNINTGEKNLEQTGSNHYMHGHSEQVDHNRDHDETAPDTHDSGKDTDQGTQEQGDQRRQYNP